MATVRRDPATVLAVLSELHETGHMTDGEHGPEGLSERGRGLVAATGRRRMRRADAEKVMERFLERAAAVNADPTLPMHVERVWLFGSMLYGSRDTVGDVDLVVVARQNPKFDRGDAPSFSHAVLRAFRDEFPASFGGMDVYTAPEALLSRRLHGAKKHPAISTSTSEATLCSLGAPCRLVFDAKRGRVDEPLLPMHPASKGRDKDMPERLPAPDFALAAGMRPCHVGFLDGGRGPLDDMAYVYDKLGHRRGLPHVWGKYVTSGEDGDGRPLDGRERFGIWLETPRGLVDGGPEEMVVVEREIEELGNGAARVDVTIRYPEFGIETTEAASEWVRSAVTCLVAADVARLEGRAIDAGMRADVTVSVEVAGDRMTSAATVIGMRHFGAGPFARATTGNAFVRVEANAIAREATEEAAVFMR
jgi:hypothetical protein